MTPGAGSEGIGNRDPLRPGPFGLVDGGFRVSAQIPMVRLRRGRFWITSRDAAGRSLPGILIAFASVIGFPPDCQFWFASCAVRT